MSIQDVNLDNVELQDFSPIKPAVVNLRVESIEEKIDDKGRNVIEVREKIVTEGMETLVPNATPSSVYNTFYFHTEKALPFWRRFVEAHGIAWDAFKANRDVQQFKGLEAQAELLLETLNQNGEALKNPRNKVKRYIIQK